MGVPGLWDILRPTGKMRALAHLATEDGFIANPNGHRAFRIGIDASIWFFHALGGREGENPELRTIFFRCARLLAMPYLPIFVFDGPGRPKIKRGKAVGGKEHWMVNSLRTVLNSFGFECRTAPGEAEAELAYLNRVGVIDAVLSDDVDCFIFGAHTVMRNGSVTLSGNRAHSAGDPQHVYVYRAQDIAVHADVGLSQGGLILVALLRGGDYDGAGIAGCGISTAHALARAGFGDTLLAAARAGPSNLNALLPTWRADLREELRTNASGFAPRKCPSVAQRITDAFPGLEVLRCYTHPLTSERTEGNLAAHGLGELWKGSADVGKIAHVCERFFEWGFEEAVVKRFRSVIWPGAVLRTLLRMALERDRQKDGQLSPGSGRTMDTPSKALARSLGSIALNESQGYDDAHSSDDNNENGNGATTLLKNIYGTRRHASTDHILEYRVEVCPRLLVARTRAGMQGFRVVTRDSAEDPLTDDKDDDENGKTGTCAPDPDSTLRLWMPASVVEYACPGLVRAFEARQARKATMKGAKGTGKGRKMEVVKSREEVEESDCVSSVRSKTPTRARVRPMKLKAGKIVEDDVKEPNKANTSYSATTAKLKERREEEENAVDPLVFKTKSSLKCIAFLYESDSSAQLAKPIQEDPFLVSAKAPITHTTDRGECVPSSDCVSHKRHPFTMSCDAEVFDHEVNFSSLTPSSSPRKHPASASSSDHEVRARRLKKSPRKLAAHTSLNCAVHKPPPERSPSPSPLRPLQRARMKPPGTAHPKKLRTPEEVIIISSDSDTPVAPLNTRRKAPKSNARHHHDPLTAFNNLNVHNEVNFIDLT